MSATLPKYCSLISFYCGQISQSSNPVHQSSPPYQSSPVIVALGKMHRFTLLYSIRAVASSLKVVRPCYVVVIAKPTLAYSLVQVTHSRSYIGCYGPEYEMSANFSLVHMGRVTRGGGGGGGKL